VTGSFADSDIVLFAVLFLGRNWSRVQPPPMITKAYYSARSSTMGLGLGWFALCVSYPETIFNPWIYAVLHVAIAAMGARGT